MKKIENEDVAQGDLQPQGEKAGDVVAPAQEYDPDDKDHLLKTIADLEQRFAEQEQLIRQREKEVEERTRALLDALYDAKKYLLILEQADLVVMLLDGASQRFVYFNKRSEDVFGFNRDDVLRKETPKILGLVPLALSGVLFGGEFEKILASGNLFRGAFAFTGKTGAQGTVRFTASRFVEEGGGFLYVLLGEDITKEREYKREERKRIEETERLNQLMIGREERMIELKRELRDLSLRCDSLTH